MDKEQKEKIQKISQLTAKRDELETILYDTNKELEAVEKEITEMLK